VRAGFRARTFHSARQIEAAGCYKGSGVFAPALLVEIGGEEETCLVTEHRIDADDEGLSGTFATRKMPPDDISGNGEEAAVRAICALDPRFLADAGEPRNSKERPCCFSKLRTSVGAPRYGFGLDAPAFAATSFPVAVPA